MVAPPLIKGVYFKLSEDEDKLFQRYRTNNLQGRGSESKAAKTLFLAALNTNTQTEQDYDPTQQSTSKTGH